MDEKEALSAIRDLIDAYKELARYYSDPRVDRFIKALTIAHTNLNTDIFKRLVYEDPDRGIIIPENATNGDAILAVFPDTEHFQKNGIITTDIDGGTLFNEDWWEAPYKMESEVDNGKDD